MVLVGVLRPGIPSVVRPSGVPVLVRSVPCPLFYTHGLIALAIRGRRLLLVHGMVGHSNLAVADAMMRLEQQGKFRFFGIRHEGAAAFAASA